MLQIVIEVDVPAGAEQGVKEKLAAYFERFGDVRVVEVREVPPEQLRMNL